MDGTKQELIAELKQKLDLINHANAFDSIRLSEDILELVRAIHSYQEEI